MNQESFESKTERDLRYKLLKSQGIISKRWVLKNQLVQYRGFGQPDNTIRDIYMLNVE